MLTIKAGLRLSAIMDIMDIRINNPKASQEEVGADLMVQIIKKAHKAENELYAFIADYKKCDIKEVANLDLIETFKEILKDSGVVNFFKNAVQ